MSEAPAETPDVKPEKLPPLNPKFKIFFTWVMQHYMLTGEVVSPEESQKQGFPVGLHTEAFSDNTFKAHLAKKAVVDRKELEDYQRSLLSYEQLMVANVLLDFTDTRSNKKKLQDLDISTSKWQAWNKDAVFRDYMAQRSQQLLVENRHEVSIALMDRIRAGDFKAIEYYNEMFGIYSRPRTGAGGSAVNVHGLVVALLEIITKHVTDPDTLSRISDDIENLIRTTSTAASLVAATEPLPIHESAGEISSATLEEVTKDRPQTVKGLVL